MDSSRRPNENSRSTESWYNILPLGITKVIILTLDEREKLGNSSWFRCDEMSSTVEVRNQIQSVSIQDLCILKLTDLSNIQWQKILNFRLRKTSLS